MQNRIVFLAILIQFSLFGQVRSENIAELDSTSLTTWSIQKDYDTINASLMLFDDNVILEGPIDFEIVGLFIKEKKPYSIRVECLNTGENINELGERILVNKQNERELSFYSSASNNSKNDILKLTIDGLEIDSVYQSEFLIIINGECNTIDINNKSIFQLNSTLRNRLLKLNGQGYFIIEHFTFYHNGILLEIPEKIGFLVK